MNGWIQATRAYYLDLAAIARRDGFYQFARYCVDMARQTSIKEADNG